MDDIKKKIKKNIDALLEKAKEADDVAAQKVIKLLAETRDQVITSLASTDWQIYYLPQKKAAVERALNEFGRKFGVVVTEAQSNGWKLGIDMVDLPIKSANIYAAIPEINTQALTVFHDFGLDKVAGLTADGIKAINNEISLGLIGNKSFFEVTQDQIISKLVDMDDKIGEMATKDELKDTERRLMDVLDEHSVILRRLDDERIVDSGRITRVENEVKKIKFQTSRP